MQWGVHAMVDLPRRVLRITGSDRSKFLQDLVTNDVKGLDTGLVYAALLTPQGKYLADFFLVPDEDAILIDLPEVLAAGVQTRLNMYRLRSDVQIISTDLSVARGLGPSPDGAFADPRHPDMGWRAYDGRDHDTQDWAGLRVSLGLPEATRDLTPDSFILEMGFERFNGVDFRKGCYVGQEVTARMKHKTTLRKGLARVAIDGPAPVGSDIIVNERAAGQLTSRVGDIGLAYLRFDRANQGNMMADTSKITLLDDC